MEGFRSGSGGGSTFTTSQVDDSDSTKLDKLLLTVTAVRSLGGQLSVRIGWVEFPTL